MANEWTEERFGSLVRFVSDKSQAKDASIDTYISTENMVVDFGGITPASALPLTGSITKFKVGDTLFSNIRTYFKKVWQAQFDGCCSNDVLVLRPSNEDALAPDYLHQICRWEKFTELSIRTSKGAKMPRGDKDALADFKFRLPPIEEQRAIAHILGTLDDKIELLRRQNETLEAMARALFKAWFVDFEPVRAKIEGRWQRGQSLPGLPAHLYDLFPDRLDEEGKPEGWEITKVETILNRLPAKIRYTKDQVSSHGKTPVFEQGASITLGFHDGDAAYQASAEDPAFVFGDHTCITKLSCQPFDISQNVIPLRGQGRPTMWVYYAIHEKQKFEEYRRHWMELITKDLVVAPNHTCLEFSKRATELHLQMEKNERESRTLAQLRDTLLPKLISGELRVPDAERIVGGAV